MIQDEPLRRTGAIAGAGTFVLTLLGALIVWEPGVALLAALGGGIAVGAGVFVAGTLADLSRPLAAPAPRPAAAGTDVPAPEPPSPMAGPPTDDTARLSPDDVVRAADLHQTIRLDQEHLDYVLPEFSPEDLFKEREGIDEQFLKAGIGIDETGTPSDNVIKGPEDTGTRPEGESR